MPLIAPLHVSRFFIHVMSENSPITPEQADAEDNDPWTSFGEFSDEDIVTVLTLLEKASVRFKVTPDLIPDAPRSPMPHHVWVHDDYVALAKSILIPYFQSHDHKPIQTIPPSRPEQPSY